jgi:hypothetical protein
MNVIEILTGILSWSALGIIAYLVYKKQSKKPKVWIVLIMMFVGIFSFSINWNMFDTMVKFPILPLGVWILYWFFRGKKEQWQIYRSFAWLGFLANFIFLVFTFISIPVHHSIYPKNDPSTYISNVKNASIIPIHPSAMNRSLNKENLRKQLHLLRQETFNSEQWYSEPYLDKKSKNEQFPYQLTGTASKWGSGLETIVYIENDGKGILVSTPKKQLYFRFQDSIIEGGK